MQKLVLDNIASAQDGLDCPSCLSSTGPSGRGQELPLQGSVFVSLALCALLDSRDSEGWEGLFSRCQEDQEAPLGA